MPQYNEGCGHVPVRGVRVKLGAGFSGNDEGSGHVPLHGHDFCEIAVVLAGDFTHITESGTQPLRRASVVIVPL